MIFARFPLRRRALLAELIGEVSDDRIRFSEDFAEDAQRLIASARKMQLEGIIGKRADAAYVSGPDRLDQDCRGA